MHPSVTVAAPVKLSHPASPIWSYMLRGVLRNEISVLARYGVQEAKVVSVMMSPQVHHIRNKITDMRVNLVMKYIKT